MAGFGGSVKLVGATEYKNDLRQISQRLKEVTAEMKSQTSAFDRGDTSMAALKAKAEGLSNVLKVQGDRVKTLTKQYEDFQRRASDNTAKHERLVAEYEKEKAKLESLGKTLGTTSKEYKEQEKKVEELKKELDKSTEAEKHNAKAVSDKKIELDKAKTAYNQTKVQLDKTNDSLEETAKLEEEVGDAAEDAGKKAKDAANGGFTVFKGVLSNLASQVLSRAADGLKTFAREMLDTAASSQALASQMEQTFGDHLGEANKRIREVAKETGVLEERLQSTATQIFAFARSNGATIPEAMELMQSALTASADSAAYYDKSLEESAETLQSFLKGNYANDAALGVSATEFTRNAKAAELFGKKYNDLTEIQKQQTLLKMVTDSQKAAGAMGQAAREADGWENVQGNLNQAWKNFQAEVGKPVLKNIIPIVQNLTGKLRELVSNIDWDAFGKKVDAAFDKLMDAFKWLIDNKDLVVGGISAVLSAMAVKKVADFGNSMLDVGKNLLSMVGDAKTAAAAQVALSTASGTATTATGGLTVATKALWAALKTNPIGLVVIGVTLAVGAFKLFTAGLEAARGKESEVVKVNKELQKSHEELEKAVAESRDAYEKNVQAVEDNSSSAEFLMKRLEALEKVEDKSTAQKKEMKSIVDQLNDVMPDLNLKYDEEKDALNQSTDALRKNISAQKDLALAKAEQAYSEEIIKKIAEAEREATKATENYEKAQNDLNEATKKRQKAEEEYLKDTWNPAKSAAFQSAVTAEEKAKKARDDAKATVEDYSSTLKDLDKQYDESAKKANEYIEKADISQGLAKLTDKLKEAGREMPQAIATGINEGIYAVPESIEQLDALINFDSALQKAGLAGQQIPASISQNLMAGKITVEEAMTQVKEAIDLADKAQQMIEQGMAIPTNLAQGIRDGTITVDEATKQMEAAITFDELMQKATDAGVAIPNNIALKVQEGAMTPQEAVKVMEAAIDFNEAVQKATDAGIKIPNTMAEQIRSGELAPNEAVQRVQQLIDYTKSFNEAGLSGKAIPNELRNGILSGQMGVTQANDAMNRWIEFKQANNEAAKAGISVPSQLASNIISKKVTVEQANKQMNNWIKFQEAIKGTKLAGAEIPTDLASEILSGKTKPTSAIDTLNRLMRDGALRMRESGLVGGQAFDDGTLQGLNDGGKRGAISGSISSLGAGMKSTLQSSINAHSPSRDAAIIGGYFLDGVYNGVANRNKQNSIFASLASFGNSLLAGLKAALQEKSPSKATEKMGVNLLAGLGIGIKDEEKSVIEQVQASGQRILGALDGQLGQGLSTNVLQSLQNALPAEFNANVGTNAYPMQNAVQIANDNLVGQFKQALSEMKIVMDDEEMGRFIDRKVTNLVYNER